MDYPKAATVLDDIIRRSETIVLTGETVDIDTSLDVHLDALFSSKTQAFREALVGCALARLDDPSIDVTKPYVKHGENAYNGRTLDERVVNPTLRAMSIPVSKAPFLSSLRRGVRFDDEMRRGIRDQVAFDSFLAMVRRINRANRDQIDLLLMAMILRFIKLRSESDIPLSKLHRVSHEQYADLITGLLATQSGGRFPVFMVEATFTAIRDAFGLDWDIVVQGINVADGASGAGGDIEIKRRGGVILAVEITERVIDKHRVQTTFQTKIAPKGIEDYLFLVTDNPEDEAIHQARQYFSQGHEVNFVDIQTYILMMLVSIGNEGRDCFNRILTKRISKIDTPATLKVTWNDHISKITSI